MASVIEMMETTRALRLLRASLRMDAQMENRSAQLSFDVSYLTRDPHKRNKALAKFKMVGVYEQVLKLVEAGNLNGALQLAQEKGIHQSRIDEIAALTAR